MKPRGQLVNPGAVAALVSVDSKVNAVGGLTGRLHGADAFAHVSNYDL